MRIIRKTHIVLLGLSIAVLSLPVPAKAYADYSVIISEGCDLPADPVNVELSTSVQITTQPVDFVGKIGDTAAFTVVAEGEGLTYRWQASTNGGSSWANSSMPGYNTATFKPQMTEQRLSYQFRCIVKDGKGNSVVSDTVKMVKAVTGPKITTQPTNYEGKIGDTATFTVVAEGEGLTYRWQASTNGGSSWANSSMAGYNTATFKPQMTEQRLSYQFRCIVKDSEGNSVVSDIVKMVKAVTGPKITTQPSDYVGKIGDTAAFTVVAEGEGLTYRWQASTNGGSSWANSSMPGYNTATFKPQMTEQRLSYQFRCILKDGKGNSVVSDTVKMVKAVTGPKITTQPSDYVGKIGDTAAFTVVAEGEGLTYRWQASTNGGSSWANSSMPGYNTATFKPQMTEQRLSYQFRCIVKDGKGNSVVSDTVKMVKAVTGPKITTQPSDYVGKIGDTAAFTVVAEGEGLTYRWQASTNGGSSWANSSMPGYDTATFKPQMTEQRLSYQFRCIVKDNKGNSAVSDTVKMVKAVSTLKITTQPVDYEGKLGDTAVFTVIAEGDGLTYCWQASTNGGSSWANSSMPGYNTMTFKPQITQQRLSYQFRCVVKDSKGNSVTSDVVKMQTDPLSPYLEQVVQLVNQERTAAGLGSVSATSQLNEAAKKRAEEIVSQFSHTRPDGTSCFTIMDEYGISWMAVAENIAAGQRTPEEVMNSWMNSEGHRGNILGANYGHIGVGCVYAEGSVYGYYWVQLFTD